MPKPPTRREMLGHSMTAAGAAALFTQADVAGAAEPPDAEPFGYCLNTSTIRGQKLPLEAEIDIAARRLSRDRAVGHGNRPVRGRRRHAGDLRKRAADVGPRFAA